MKTLRIYLSAMAALFIIASCTKPVEADPPLLQDGPNPALGKQIHLPKRNTIGINKPVWGKNDDELFINSASNQLFRLNLKIPQVELINNYGAITGIVNEQSALVYTGYVKSDQLGYYTFNFNMGRIEEMLTFSTSESSVLSVAGNNIFYTVEKSAPPRQPCNGFCIPLYPNGLPTVLNHLNKLTGDKTTILNKFFYGFSKDGTKTILSTNGKLFLYENATRQITDSFDYQFMGKVYYDDVPKSYQITVAGEIVITNMFTNVVLDQFMPQVTGIIEINLSADGSKIYYTGSTPGSQSFRILIYDLITKKETVAVSASTYFLQPVLSGNNKKIFFRTGDDYYIKDLN